MAEGNDILTYHGIALTNSEELRRLLQSSDDDKGRIDELVKLIIGLRLVGGPSHERPSRSDLITARRMLLSYFEHCKSVYKPGSITYKIHCLIHLVDEAAHFGAHLGSFDAYAFENFLSCSLRAWKTSVSLRK